MASATRTIPTELGTEQVGKLLKQYALPAIVAQIAASLYNMVDRIYIGHMNNDVFSGSDAISGLAVTFPLMNLSTAFGTLVGAGAATMISILLGQKHYHMGNKVLGNVVSLNIIIGFLFMGVTLAFLDPILMFFGASEATLPYAKDYITIILYGNIITHLYFGLNAAMRASGNPTKAMGLTIFTVILNAILDPIFIFGFNMGIAGAAWATVISQTTSMLIVLHHFNNRNRAIHFEKGIFRLNLNVAEKSLVIGTGPFLMNLAACAVTLLINLQLRSCNSHDSAMADYYIAAFGICNSIVFMFIMICMGLNQGMQPIAGYNYGAKLYSRVKDVFWKTAKLGMVTTTICFLIGMFIPRIACSIFTTDAALLDIAQRGMRCITLMFPIVGLQMIGTNFFQSLGLVKKSIILSLSRQLLMLIPLLYILPQMLDGVEIFGISLQATDGVWLSFPISDILSTILTVILLRRLFRKFNHLTDGATAMSLDD